MESGVETPSAPKSSSGPFDHPARPRVGRSRPRSRLGCTTCKQRRVRCDEVHPICGHCRRLQLECHYKPPATAPSLRRKQQEQQQQQQQFPQSSAAPVKTPTLPLQSSTATPNYSGECMGDVSLSRRGRERNQHAPDTPPAGLWYHSRSGYATPNQNLYNGEPWAASRRSNFHDIFSDLEPSWAGDFSCVLPDINTPPESSFALESIGGAESTNGPLASRSMILDAPGPAQPLQFASQIVSRPPVQGVVQDHYDSSILLSHPSEAPERNTKGLGGGDVSDLIRLFRNIVQPPAAILIGGFERWRRLRHYLCKLSDHFRAVQSALLCLIELLVLDNEKTRDREQSHERSMKRILERHAAACQEIKNKISKHSDLRRKTREHLLAAIFLLSWFEVIRDQDSHPSLFPRYLAEVVITSGTTWSRHSQQLLSWLNTLDSKATHLGREHLLSPKTLEAVSHFPTQITSSLEHGEHGENLNAKDDVDDDSELSLSDLSPGDSHHSPDDMDSHYSPLSMGQVKVVLLNTILQPALEWYLTSQSYCRRISAYDKHHRQRFTSDDEYEVITACRQLECELFELWDNRPSVISLPADQLTAVVAPDLAKRLEEIFSVYLASFWILFVYLHRISWWNLPLSPLARRALSEVWQSMQRAYGEEVNGPLRKIIHPSLLWPLFLFGTECGEEAQWTWAIEQLEALGEAKRVVAQPQETDSDMLPPFKLSSGATRNAKRAAKLLAELVKEQDAKKARVDDRDLSMKLFGCYFSMV